MLMNFKFLGDGITVLRNFDKGIRVMIKLINLGLLLILVASTMDL